MQLVDAPGNLAHGAQRLGDPQCGGMALTGGAWRRAEGRRLRSLGDVTAVCEQRNTNSDCALVEDDRIRCWTGEMLSPAGITMIRTYVQDGTDQ